MWRASWPTPGRMRFSYIYVPGRIVRHKSLLTNRRHDQPRLGLINEKEDFPKKDLKKTVSAEGGTMGEIVVSKVIR